MIFSICGNRFPIYHFYFFTCCDNFNDAWREHSNEASFPFGVFIMLFAQLEVFIYLGNRLFADLNFDKSPGEITRIVVFRFLIFLAGCLLVSMILFILLQYAGLWINGEDVSLVFYNFIHTGYQGVVQIDNIRIICWVQ